MALCCRVPTFVRAVACAAGKGRLSAVCPVALVVLWLFAQPGVAQAQDRRMALIVGNSAYTEAEVLPNAARDARAVANAVENLGFEVTLLLDTDFDQFTQTVARFARRADAADAVLFYFSGHAFQLSGINYLAPVSASLRSVDEIEAQTLRIDEIIAQISGRGRQTIVMLDACRNNPLPPSLRSTARDGLAQTETGTDTFVAFATQPNNITFDGRDGNSPFTTALLTHLDAPGISISDMMIRVRSDVSRNTLGRQIPWDQSSLTRPFYFNAVQSSDADMAEVDFDMFVGKDREWREWAVQFLVSTGMKVTIEEIDAELRARGLLEDAPLELAAAPPEPAAELPVFSTVPLDQRPAAPDPELAQDTTPEARPEDLTPDDAADAPPVTEDPGAEFPVVAELYDEIDAVADAREAAVPAEDTPAVVAEVPEVMPEPATDPAQVPETAPATEPPGQTDETETADDAQPGPDPATEADAIAADDAPFDLAALPEATRPLDDPLPLPRAGALQLPEDDTDFPDISSMVATRVVAQPASDMLILAALDPGQALTPHVGGMRRIIGVEVEPEEVPDNIVVALQEELQRVGCYRMRVDGQWGPGSARALVSFYSRTGLTPPSSPEPSVAIWRVVRDTEGEICPPPAPVAQAPRAQTTPTRTAPQPTQRVAPAQQPTPRAAPAPQQPAASSGRGIGGAGRGVGGLR